MKWRAWIVADLDTSLRHGESKAAMNLAHQQLKNRTKLVASRNTGAGKLAQLQVQMAAIDGERKTLEADLGPLRYLATLPGSTDDQIMRWSILGAVALLRDAAVVPLLPAATHRGRS